MAIIITDDCINCGACEPACPNNAIYEGGSTWRMSDGTKSSDGGQQDPLKDNSYFIAPDKCTECVGFHDEPQCASVCPVDCCIDDQEKRESKDVLMVRKQLLHGE